MGLGNTLGTVEILCVALGVGACSAGGGGTRDSFGGVTLEAHATREANPVGGQQADGRWVVVDLTLENQSGLPVPSVASSFLVQSASGLQYPGDVVATGAVSGGCPVENLGPGGAVRCTVLADLPLGQRPDTLQYLVSGSGGQRATCR